MGHGPVVLKKPTRSIIVVCTGEAFAEINTPLNPDLANASPLLLVIPDVPCVQTRYRDIYPQFVWQ